MIKDRSVTRRVAHHTDLPDEALRCAAAGRHLGFTLHDPAVERTGGWGPLDAAEIFYRCMCGRWKRETVDLDTGETLSRSADYGGGVLLATGGTAGQREAKAEWLRRVRTRAARHGADVRPLQGGQAG